MMREIRAFLGAVSVYGARREQGVPPPPFFFTWEGGLLLQLYIIPVQNPWVHNATYDHMYIYVYTVYMYTSFPVIRDSSSNLDVAW
jgi:hypothetical protein